MTTTAGSARHRLARTFAAAPVAAAVLFTSAAAAEPADAFALHQAALTAERQGEMTLAIDSFDRACAMKLAPSCTMAGLAKLDDANGSERSEEHTSELQSLMRISYAVFCLKKKK